MGVALVVALLRGSMLLALLSLVGQLLAFKVSLFLFLLLHLLLLRSLFLSLFTLH